MRIGDLANHTEASVRSLRYYEDRGLLDSSRAPSGQRHYGPGAVNRVQLIRQLLGAGLTTAAIADVLPCVSDPGVQTEHLTRRLIEERDRIDGEIAQRRTTRAALQRLIEAAPPIRP